MKTIFDKATRDELIVRINTLNEHSVGQWGKMNVYQMIKHCTLAEEMFLGKKKYKRSLIGWLIGKRVLKNLMKDEAQMVKNAPTAPGFEIAAVSGDIEAEKNKWTALVEEYADFSNAGFKHWFFGKMTDEQVGYFAYIHSDHHLRQFNS